MRYFLIGSALAPMVLGACSAAEAPATTNFNVVVAPLELPGIAEASYAITVRNRNDEVVWDRRDLSSIRFGDGKGSLSYVGTCDASPGANPHEVSLELLSLTEVGGAPADFANPAPEGAPITIEATCRENADTPVTFDLTIARAAKQGFFDIAVSFDDVFCSAKLDCLDDDGVGPRLLLHDASGERARTIVMGFACSDGKATMPNAILHLSDVAIECTHDGQTETYYYDPTGGPGNTDPLAPVFFQTAAYRGGGNLGGAEQCYWNLAFGVNEGAAGFANCTLIAQGTVTDSALTNGATADGKVYPYIDWRVPISGADGEVTCGNHPLNGDDGRVSTKYTGPTVGAGFAHSYVCGGDVSSEGPTVECGGAQVGVVGYQNAEFTQSAGGISVSINGAAPSSLYKLPAQYGELGACCLNPCCQELQ